MARIRRTLPLVTALLVAAPLCAGAPDSGALPARADHARERIHALRSDLGLDTQTTFAIRRFHGDELGQTHTRLRQFFQGVPVWGAEVIAHTGPEGDHLPATLAHRSGININVVPSLRAQEIRSVVHDDLAPAGPYAIEPVVELVIYPEEVRVAKSGRAVREAEPLDATAFAAQVRRYVLAYHVHTEIHNPGDTRHTDYLVDAHTGAILEKWDSLMTANAEGTGNSQYSGTVRLSTTTIAGGFELRDLTRPATLGNTVNNLNHATAGTGTVYTDADNIWGDGLNYLEDPEPTTSANGQTVAVDAAFGLQTTWDMFKNVLGRNGIDGLGRSTYARVHYDNGYDNAFYSDQCMCITYGDGTKRLPYTPLDIAAHEFSHGVCSTTAGLIYNKESGGLNESNSDIFGVLTEFYYRGANGQGSVLPDTGGNWTQGEQIATPLAPQYRRMYKPSLDGKSADAWSPTLYTLNVHYSSGPMNRCFYFLSQGATTGGDTSSTYLPGGMPGIGNQKAAKIWYRALTTYMTPSTDYAAARIAMITAARDLYPLSGPEEVAVWNAFAAINVGTGWAGADAAPVVTVSESGSKGNVTFNATASDDKGVAKVDFLLDGAVVGTVTAPPYTMTYDSLMQDDGTHTLVATATDSVGLFSRASLDFLIDNGQLIRNASFEKGYGVGWSNTTGMEIGAILNTPSYDGTKCAKFRGRGSAGSVALFQDAAIPATAASANLSFALKVETKETSSMARDTFAVQIRSTSGAILQTLATYSNLDASPNYKLYSFDVSAFRGQTVQVYFVGTEDAAISTGFILDKVNLMVTGGGSVDSTPPTVSAAESGSSGVITLSATASDLNGVSKVEFWVDGVLKGTDTTTPFSMTLDSTTLLNGTHSLVAKAFDPSNNVGTSTPVSFTVSNAGPDTTPPTVTATESGSSGTITFSATADDLNGVTRVDFYVDGVLKGTDATAPFGMTLDSTTLTNASHTLVAMAYDPAGNAGTSSGVAFTINNAPPSSTYNEIESNGSLATANPLADSVTKVVGTIGSSTDQDFYRVTVAAGRSLTVNMTGPAKDYDLYLLSSTGSGAVSLRLPPDRPTGSLRLPR
jgi:Zn-dependent metalloprotease